MVASQCLTMNRGTPREPCFLNRDTNWGKVALLVCFRCLLYFCLAFFVLDPTNGTCGRRWVATHCNTLGMGRNYSCVEAPSADEAHIHLHVFRGSFFWWFFCLIFGPNIGFYGLCSSVRIYLAYYLSCGSHDLLWWCPDKVEPGIGLCLTPMCPQRTHQVRSLG